MSKPTETSRIIEMAWEDRTTFDSIKDQFGLSESEVIKIMRKHMKRSSFKMWRKRFYRLSFRIKGPLKFIYHGVFPIGKIFIKM